MADVRTAIPVAQLGDDRFDPRPAPQRQRHGLAQPLDAIGIANPQQDHLPPLKGAA